ncbi:MAG: hypothetical protein HC782_03740 [Gammaproteobacteria bacterium]|nr:hypothetical protein [Gammaproteobacteria bacterium]
MQSLALNSADAPRAIVALRHEVIASTEFTAPEKTEIKLILDALQAANLYGKIALVGQLKQALSAHAGFRSHYAEYAIYRSS